jgi:hypothetical protein
MRKPTRKGLVKKLDAIVSLIVRARDKRCVTCGSAERLQCGHLITRSKHKVRWSLTNCNCQCASCNLSHEYNPHPYTQWFIERYGLQSYKDLIRESNNDGMRFSDLDLKNKLEYLTNTYGKNKGKALPLQEKA